MVIGCRPIRNHPEFRLRKKILQVFGSWALRKISNTNVRDAASGFVAFQEKLSKVGAFLNFLIQWKVLFKQENGLRLASVDIVNKKQRIKII